MREEQITKKELLEKIRSLGNISKEQRNSIVCALIGHSRISDSFWGYRHCGRCGELLGDSLGGVDMDIGGAVIIGHNCPTCRKNYKKCDWRDKIYTPNPFPENVKKGKIRRKYGKERLSKDDRSIENTSK